MVGTIVGAMAVVNPGMPTRFISYDLSSTHFVTVLDVAVICIQNKVVEDGLRGLFPVLLFIYT